MKIFNYSIWHNSLLKFKYYNNALAKINYLLLKNDDIHYYSHVSLYR